MKHKPCKICKAPVYMQCNVHGKWKADCKCNYHDSEWICSANHSHKID